MWLQRSEGMCEVQQRKEVAAPREILKRLRRVKKEYVFVCLPWAGDRRTRGCAAKGFAKGFAKGSAKFKVRGGTTRGEARCRRVFDLGLGTGKKIAREGTQALSIGGLRDVSDRW